MRWKGLDIHPIQHLAVGNAKRKWEWERKGAMYPRNTQCRSREVNALLLSQGRFAQIKAIGAPWGCCLLHITIVSKKYHGCAVLMYRVFFLYVRMWEECQPNLCVGSPSSPIINGPIWRSTLEKNCRPRIFPFPPSGDIARRQRMMEHCCVCC